MTGHPRDVRDREVTEVDIMWLTRTCNGSSWHPPKLNPNHTQALAWSRPLTPVVTLVRPLLAVGRHQTLELCSSVGLQVWTDSTNSDNKLVIWA